MRNNMLCKKALVVGIIVLFVGISVIPSTGKIDVTTSGITIYDGSLSGYVNDTSMGPIGGVRVRVYFHGTYEENYSDSTGYYHVTNIPICWCMKNCTASKDGYTTEWVWLAIYEDTTYDFVLTPLTQYDGSLSGYVNDTSMNPIEGARVRVYFHETYEEDYSDEDGYYYVTNIPICYCLKNATCSKEGYETEWVLLGIVEDTTYDFILTSNNHPPDRPSIHGPPSGRVGKPYEFFFSAVDPDGDNVSFYIEWGDGTSYGWTHFYPSGADCSCSHAWFKMLRYNLRAKAKDIYGNESDWGYMSIHIPRNKAFNIDVLELLFERFPNMFPILRHLLRL